MTSYLLALATGKRVLLALAVFVVGGGLLFRLGPYREVKSLVGGRPLPEESTTAGPELQTFLESLGSEGRTIYARFQLWDLLNPVLIGVAGTLLLAWLVKRIGLARGHVRHIVWIPVLAAGADLVENVLLRAAIGSFPALPAPALPLVTQVKLVALMVFVLLSIGLAMVAVTRRAFSR